ncbi:LysR family transcriptional regulator [Ideonella azotifigens]|uniref:LysR family transcriptional regulator n=2 Tax=Ideonella azotifigens TaxID=513160 RepID=A0ABP3VVJ5_9BURK|nr:LysR family transcriptional regulator [Ideonella azotifigens]MCD2339285.1 LysR family transcriptional regulator [Ideonella azotifigens]
MFSSEAVRVFLTVVDHGSFSAAARALGRMPSAVSMAVAQLEAELDLQLFERQPRSTPLTPAGRALLPQARLAASHLQRLAAQALALHEAPQPRLSLAIAPELVGARWHAPLAALAQAFPPLELDVRVLPQAEAMALLREGEVQLALVFERHALEAWEGFEELGCEVLVAAASRSWLAGLDGSAPLRSETLQETRQILVGSKAGGHDPRLVHSANRWEAGSHMAAVRLVEAGLGWAFLPRSMLPPAGQGELVELAFDNMSNQVSLWVDVVWHRERPLSSVAQRYLALLREGLRSEPPL